MARRRVSECRFLVTGASSGIGRALVLQLHRRGGRVLALARRAERLAELAEELEPCAPMIADSARDNVSACATQGGADKNTGGVASAGADYKTGAPAETRLLLLAGDVTNPQVRTVAVEAMRNHFGGIDVLINNAGLGAMGLFEHADADRLRRIMEVNFFAAAEMIRLTLPLLKESRCPMIVNVGSILGHRAVPHNSEYSAAKFALHGFSEALRAELSGYGIDVLVVAPGTTDTEFFDRVIERTSAPRWPKHRPVSAEYVARKTISAIERGKAEIIPYLWGKLLILLNRLSPRLVDRLMRRYV